MKFFSSPLSTRNASKIRYAIYEGRRDYHRDLWTYASIWVLAHEAYDLRTNAYARTIIKLFEKE